MQNKKIIITDSLKLSNFTTELSLTDYTVIDSDHTSLLNQEPEKVESIYIEENTLTNHPEIFSKVNKIHAPPKVIVSNQFNIIQNILKNKKYNDLDKIPSLIERVFLNFLHKCMIKDNHSGYIYLKHTFFILYLDPTAAFNIKKSVYLPIEARFNTPEESVERCIKYAIKGGYKLSKQFNCDNIFNHFKALPSNKAFIEASFRYIKHNYPEFKMAYVSAEKSDFSKRT